MVLVVSFCLKPEKFIVKPVRQNEKNMYCEVSKTLFPGQYTISSLATTITYYVTLVVTLYTDFLRI